jgi:diguanylate cyclase (GGDEF)-like protein
MPDSRPWPVILPILFFCLLAFGVGIVFKIAWVTALVAVAVLIVSVFIVGKAIRSSHDMAVLSAITRPTAPEDNILAYQILAEIDLSITEKKSPAMIASEIIRKKFQLERFAIFFRENDKYVPLIYSRMNKGELGSPSIQKLGPTLKKDIQQGALSRDESDCLLAFKRDRGRIAASTITFAYSWGRGRSVYVVANDPQERFSEAVKDPQFNRVFWPGLDSDLKLNQKLRERSFEVRELSGHLEQSKKDIVELNRELKNKLLDLKAFVNISNDLFSLFDEEELFTRIKNIVRENMTAISAEILLASGDGRFIPQSAMNLGQMEIALSLDSDSELADLISKSSKPVPLPLAGTGLKQNDPFLQAAFAANFQIAVAIKAGGGMACVLLVGRKKDKSQYTGQELDFLNIICNIASLSLENIYQYSTIEKLSYTDSMTGIYNYRYFYKRLNEEILRAKRYNRELALVILDIDNFKLFNDNYGHQAGDLVLKQLSDLITRTIRSIDVVSRYGGEEFCIIMPDTGVDNCRIFIERLRSQIADFRFESELLREGNRITISVGGAVYPHHAPTPDRLIYCADMALLRAKALGRNRAVMYESEESSNSVEGGYDESHQESLL